MGVTNFVAAVDAFRPVSKTLIGADITPEWKRGRQDGERKLVLPIEVGGEQSGQALMIVTCPNNPTLMFRIGIKFFEHVICRIDFDLDARHTNNARSWADGLPPLVIGPHWHRWELNRSSINSISSPLKLPHAIPFNDAKRFDSVLRAFCADWSIELGRHAIDLPPRDALL